MSAGSPCGATPSPRSTRPSRDLKVPHNAAQRPPQSEPLGGLLALLGGLFEDDVKAIYVRGGLSDFRSVLETPLDVRSA